MEKKKSNLSERSKCCGSRVVIRGKTTIYYVCLLCGDACDIYVVDRKMWQINPSTKVKGDERDKQKRKESDKEIKENT